MKGIINKMWVVIVLMVVFMFVVMCSKFERDPVLQCILKKEGMSFWMPRYNETSGELFFLVKDHNSYEEESIEDGIEYGELCKIIYPDTTTVYRVISYPICEYDLSHDGKKIVFRDTSGEVFLYDISKDSLSFLDIEGWGIKFSYSGDGVFFYSGNFLFYKEFSGTLYQVGEVEHKEDISIGPGDSLIALGNKIYSLLWEVGPKLGKLLFTIRSSGGSIVAFNPQYEGWIAVFSPFTFTMKHLKIKNIFSTDSLVIDVRPYEYSWFHETSITWKDGDAIIFACCDTEGGDPLHPTYLELWVRENIKLK